MKRGLLTLAFVLCAGLARADCVPDQVQLRGDWGQIAFTVEIADDPKERAQGLMFREEMPRLSGMLFVYDAPGRASFWMKNTLIPLDIIFLDESGTVTRIHHNAQPGDLRSIDGGDRVFAVLEINGGLARRFGITHGSQMRHRVFSPDSAIWPC